MEPATTKRHRSKRSRVPKTASPTSEPFSLTAQPSTQSAEVTSPDKKLQADQPLDKVKAEQSPVFDSASGQIVVDFKPESKVKLPVSAKDEYVHDAAAEDAHSSPRQPVGTVPSPNGNANGVRPSTTKVQPANVDGAPALAATVETRQDQEHDPDQEYDPEQKIFSWGNMILIGLTVAVAGMLLWRLLRKGHGSSDYEATTNGTLDGVWTPVGNRSGVMLYLRVPYGLSTAYQRRFADPIPLGDLGGRHVEASMHGLPCAQWRDRKSVGDEDCLHLAVWSPVRETTTSNSTYTPRKNRTMVVALTGDWFQSGSNSDYDWAELAVSGDLVVVSPNHRHGVAGFFNVPFDDVAKNSAIEDVLLALSWIKRNAAAFDGDPDNIVALGHGSGAFILLSIILKGRERSDVAFKRTLLQGPPLPSMPLPRNTPDMGMVYLRNISQSLSFRGHKPEDQFAFLRAAKIEDLLRASQELRIPLRFVPSGFKNGPKLLEKSATEAISPEGLEVILGTDLSEGRAFNERFILPFALSRKSSDDAVSIFETVCVFVKEAECTFDRRNSTGVDWLKTLTKEEFLEYLAYFWTVCSSVAIADTIAGTKGKVHHYVSEGSRLFEPYLSPDTIAAFLTSGHVPPTSTGSLWPVYTAEKRVSVLFKNDSQEIAEDVAQDICRKMQPLLSYLS